MRWLKVSLAVILLQICSTVQSASILALFSSLSYSDHLVFRGYVSSLAQRGHNVVMMTPYPGHFTHPEVDKIVELDVGPESSKHWEEYKTLVTKTDDYYHKLQAINEFSLKLAINQLKSKQMTALFINPNIKFDLVITEADVPLLYAVAEKYKAPHIAITATSGKIHQYEAKGNPIHPILYPDVNALNHGNLTRWQKVVEFYRHLQTKHEYYNNYLPLSEVAAKKILGLERALQDVEYDIDLLFITANPLMISSRPTVPAIIYTDRLHITQSAPVLSEQLQATLDSAKNGAVYFSIGALQDSEELNPRLLQTLAEAFGELPFTVLWKIANTTMLVNKPANLITASWFPQQAVLAHPNVKAFLTHGGPRSLEEALFYEVPIVGLPFIKSRKVFMEQYTKHGAGQIIDPYYLEKDAFKAAVTEVASNQNYKQNMAKRKSLVVDDMISGPFKAVWWTEYVIRNGGARFLRSPAVGVTFVQYYMLDMVAILLSGAILSLWLSYRILRYVLYRLRLRFQNRNVDLGGKFKAL